MSAQDKLLEILSKLSGAHRSGKNPNQYAARCPAHADTEASFAVAIGEAGDRIVVKCFAGCELSAILAALGETEQSMFCGPPKDRAQGESPAPKKEDHYTPTAEWEERFSRWTAQFKEASRKALVEAIDVPERFFVHFPMLGVHNEHPDGVCFAHPEVDADGRITGAALRFVKTRAKRSAAGSKRGLTVPDGWKERAGPLFVVEGLSDVMAGTAAGLCVIGRPGVAAGLRLMADFVEKHVPADRELVVVGENDERFKAGGKSEWPGRDGALKFAGQLAAETGRRVRICMPPNREDKDMRNYLVRLEADGVPWGEVGSRWLQFMKPEEVAPEAKRPEPRDPLEDNRPVISLDNTNQMVTNNETLKHLAKDTNLFARGNMLVRSILVPGKVVCRGKDEKGNPKPVHVWPEQSRLSAIEVPTLRERISAQVRFEKTFIKGTRSVDVPDWCVTAIHAREEWPNLKNLTALVDYPVLRPDGTIFHTRGHDEVTGVFYNHVGAIAVPDRPTAADAARALESLREVVCDFPFESPDVHFAAWLAALLTPMTRFAYNGCAPLFLIDGNMAGAGKGLLADTISLILTGRPFATMGYTDDNTEMSKRITAIAVEGDQMVMFDNIAHGFGGAAIDRALTSLEWSERILGQTRNIKCPLRVNWYGTGNNVEFVGDSLRRLCQIRIESPDEKPEERRNFRHRDLRAWIMVNRDRLLSAAATILAAYYAAGAPRDENLPSWGSFEAWSDCVRQCVVWLGLADPMATRELVFTEGDASRSLVRAVIAAWPALLRECARDGVYRLTANEIVQTVFPYDESNRKRPTPASLAELADAMLQLSQSPSGRMLAQHFKKHRNTRFFGGQYLTTFSEDRRGVLHWTVKSGESSPRGAGIAGIAGSLSNPTRVKTQSEKITTPQAVESDPAIPAIPAPEIVDNSDTQKPDSSKFTFGDFDE